MSIYIRYKIVKANLASVSLCCKSHRFQNSKYWNFICKFNAQKLAIILCQTSACSGVTKGAGAEGGSCYRALHARGCKTAAPKYFMNILTTTKVSLINVVNEPPTVAYHKFATNFCYYLLYNRLQIHWDLAYLPSCLCFQVYLGDIVQFFRKFVTRGGAKGFNTKKLWRWSVWRDAFAPSQNRGRHSQYEGLMTLSNKI